MLYARAYAKINWSLDIVGLREDGYHLMDMLMQTISLHDTLSFEMAEDITLLAADNPVPTIPYDDSNLIVKTARLLQKACHVCQGVRIRLDKKIPSGAGLGGGSADAAATLMALNTLWKLHLSKETLHEYALQLGADVPFLLEGGLARVGGIGEIITPLRPPSLALVVVQPCHGLSTKEIFTDYDNLSSLQHPNLAEVEQALLQNDCVALSNAMGNVLAYVSEPKCPQIRIAIEKLISQGATGAMMTGSGSAVFGVYSSKEKALHAYEELQREYECCHLCESISHGIGVE